MGKVLGIVGEYNPFHNGHLYHLEQSKKMTSSNYTVAIMSGNFTQRGSTAIIDKWSRAEVALKNGIDLVLELPVLYATSSAENFASGAIKLLDSLKVVDYVSFGAETSNIDILSNIADILIKEPKEYKNLLNHELSKGHSFPKARENALMMYLNDIKKYSNILSGPNNILGIEYIKALKKYKSNIQPISIARFEAGYNDTSYSGNIASATAIRNIVKNGAFNALAKLLPESSYRILINNIKLGYVVPDLSVFEKQIIYNLRNMTTSQISELADVNEGLEFALKKASNSCNKLIELMRAMKSKRYTSTRIQRILLYSLLNITKKDIALSKKTNPYMRVLGATDRGKFIISEIAKANPKLEIVTSVKRFTENCHNKNVLSILDKDIWATNVYSLGYENDAANNLDFSKSIVTL